LNLEEVNFLAGTSASYALVAVAGELLLLDTRCPHRGGPLHLGATSSDARGRIGLRCPWHGTFVPLARLRTASLPMVWRAHTGEAAVILPAEAEVTAMLRHPHTTHEPATNPCLHAAPCIGVAPDASLDLTRGAQP
jgi:hypothetical protein